MSNPTTDHPLLSPGIDDDIQHVVGDTEDPHDAQPRLRDRLTPMYVSAGVLIVAGLVLIGLGWWGVSGTREVWEQIPYFVSGGLGGLGLIGLGVLAYVAHSHTADRRVLQDVIARLDELEMGLAGEFDVLTGHVDGSANGAKTKL